MLAAILAQTIATVSVSLAAHGPTIPSDFDGMSMEVDSAATQYLVAKPFPNLVFEQLLRNLGSATIRVGGNSTDNSCWNPSAAPYRQGCFFQIGPAMLNGFAQASARTGWSEIVGVNLAQNSATWAAPYGRAVAQAFAATPGSKLIGFEFGNEPDLYSQESYYGTQHSIRPKNYSWPNLVSDWKPYAAAFEKPTTR